MDGKGKQFEDFTFNELHDEYTRMAHSKLLERGGPGLRDAVFMIMQASINWSKAQIEKEKAAKRAKRKLPIKAAS